uniref:Uncharacterized protein n=1 Tax=Spermophilus dauricus TaxID=99837 RepID=A0A8C9UUM9_SPEDA
MTFSTKSNNFIIFLSEVKAAVTGFKSCDFLAVLDQLDPDTLPDGRIWPFGFNPYLFQHCALYMGSTSQRVGLGGGAKWVFLYCLLCHLRFLGDFGASWWYDTGTPACLAGATGKRTSGCQMWQHTPVIPAIQEAEAGGSQV